MSVRRLETTAAIELLLSLLDRPRYIGELIRSSINEDGIASQAALTNARTVLSDLGLIEEYVGDVRPRVYLRLTEKGSEVAKHLKAIEEVLQVEE